MKVRKATLDDIDILVRLRIDYIIADWGPQEAEVLAVIEKNLREFFPRHLSTGEFVAFIAEEGGEAAATAFLSVTTIPANPTYVEGKVGTVLNVLTYPHHRKKGYGSAVLRELIEEAKRLGVSAITLSATQDGLPMYQKLGFEIDTQYTEMKMKLKTGLE